MLASIKERSFPLSIPAALKDRIAFYRRYLEAGIRFGESRPSAYFRVQYELLAQTPDAALSELMRWLGERLNRANWNLTAIRISRVWKIQRWD
jgi:hypothetical protein